MVTLEEKANSIERHAWTTVHPRVMGEDMEKQTVHTQGEIAVEQGFDTGGSLIPYAANLGESFCLYVLFTIDMCAADGIEHIVGLVVGG